MSRIKLSDSEPINEDTLKGVASGYENNLKGFEEDLEVFLSNNSFVTCTNTGTAAIHLALIISGISKGDEVLCQSMTFIATSNPIVYLGATPIFIDSEEETWNMCPVLLEEAIQDRIKKGKKPKAIIVVHLYGMPAKIEEISKIAKVYGITLIEDAAESLGSTYKGQKCGTFGDFGILSFNTNKIITANGGGALVCKDEENKEKAKYLSNQARDDRHFYQHSQIGYNYKMSDILAGVGRKQINFLESYINLRRNNNNFYKNIFKETKGVSLLSEPSNDFFSTHWLTCVKICSNITSFTRENIRQALLEDNIESRPLWKPMHMQPVFKNAIFYGDNFSGSLFEKGLCLPSGSNLTIDDKNRISGILRAFI